MMDEHTTPPRIDTPEHDPLLPPGGDGTPTDAGGYIGHEPELARETIPGGVQRGDVRVSSVATRPTGAGADAHAAALGTYAPDEDGQRPDTEEDLAGEKGR